MLYYSVIWICKGLENNDDILMIFIKIVVDIIVEVF
jgi:hypothetical protein